LTAESNPDAMGQNGSAAQRTYFPKPSNPFPTCSDQGNMGPASAADRNSHRWIERTSEPFCRASFLSRQEQ
jgi:hypothetical protein